MVRKVGKWKPTSKFNQHDLDSFTSILHQSVSNFNATKTTNCPVALNVSSCPNKVLLKSQKAQTFNLDASTRSDSIQTYNGRRSSDRSLAFKLTRAITDLECLKDCSDTRLDDGMPHRPDPPGYETISSNDIIKKRLPVADVKSRWRSRQIANQLRFAEGTGNFWNILVLPIPRLPFTKVTRRNPWISHLFQLISLFLQ